MATALATGRLTKSKRPHGRNLNFCPLTLEEVAEALQASKPRTLRRDCLESRDRAYRWCVRKVFGERSSTFRTSITQAAAGMGYRVSGDRDDDESRCGQSVRRCLKDLEEAGLIQWSGVKRPDGRWRCIEICMLDNRSTTHDNGGYVNSMT
jgi:hypothetical protein